MSRPKLIMMVGLPRSGKSTRAKHMANHTPKSVPIVNPDSIRLALHGQPYIQEAEPYVWAIAKTMVRSLFLAGHDEVIFDACNNTKKRRDEMRSKHWDRVYHIIDTPAEVCIERVGERTELIPVIERMAAQHEPVEDFDEDFDRDL